MNKKMIEQIEKSFKIENGKAKCGISFNTEIEIDPNSKDDYKQMIITKLINGIKGSILSDKEIKSIQLVNMVKEVLLG